MAQYREKALQILEGTYNKLISKPNIELDADESASRAELLYQLTEKMTDIEIAKLQKLQTAIAAEGDQMQRALQRLEHMSAENTDYPTMLQGVDYALQIMNNFMLMLF